MDTYTLSLYEVLTILYEQTFTECFCLKSSNDPCCGYAFRTLMDILGTLDRLDDFKNWLDSHRDDFAFAEKDQIISFCKEECDRLEDFYNGTLYAEDTDFEKIEEN